MLYWGVGRGDGGAKLGKWEDLSYLLLYVSSWLCTWLLQPLNCFLIKAIWHLYCVFLIFRYLSFCFFWLHNVSAAALGLSLVVESGGYSLAVVCRLSLL